MTALGLFVDARRLDGSHRSPAAHLGHTLELLVGAESLGCEATWFTEHHGFSDGYLPQPLVLAAAVAARTTRMRLGTAVLLAGLRHARHIAEEAALVDLISNGRLELGFGAGYAQSEYDAFDVDMARRFDRTDATALEVRRLLDSGEVTPGSVQQPLPLWLGYQGPKGATRAGRCGMGLLSLDSALVEPYRAGLEAGGLTWSSARMGGLVDIIVADDPPRAVERLLPHWLHQQNTYRALRTKADGSPLTPLDMDRARDIVAKTGRLGSLQVMDVDGAVNELRDRTSGIPAEHAYTWLSLADMPDELTERHVELWCGPVRQAFDAISQPTA
jgi:alkanesulfonate monooxygenase SsuD/methylene tetrahydromethanopterin reductase-like flavin-dependent oxidoreductase (luciferase family)